MSINLHLRSLPIFSLLLLSAVSALAQKPQLSVQVGHSTGIKAIAFSPDGTLLASAAADSTVKLWDVATGREVRTLNARDQGQGSETLAFSPDGQILAGGGFNGSIKLWDVQTGRALAKLTAEDEYEVFSVAFSPDGKFLAGAQGSIHVWEVGTGLEAYALKGHTDGVTSIAFAPNGKTLVSGGGDKTIKVWNLDTRQAERTLKGHTDYISSIALSPDGRSLASVDGAWQLKLWDVAAGHELWSKQFTLSSGPLCFSPDGATLAVPVGDVAFIDTKTGELKSEIKASKNIQALRYSPDGKLVAGGDLLPSLHLWDVATGQELSRWKWHAAQVSAVAFRDDGRMVAIGSTDRTVRLWDLTTGQAPRVLKGHLGAIRSLAFSPDGKLLASGDTQDMLGLHDEKVIIWDVGTGQALHTLLGAQPGRKPKPGYPNSVLSLAFSPDGKLLASASHDNLIKLWDVAAGREVRALVGHAKSVIKIAFSADGRQLISHGYDQTVRLWDVNAGRELSHYQSKEFSHFEAVAFAPDGRAVAIGWQPDGLKVLDISNGGRELLTFKESANIAGKGAAVSPDSKTVAVADYYEDGTKIWDLMSGTKQLTLKGHANDVYAIAFSPDRKFILTGSADATAKLWDASTGAELVSLVALDQDDWMVAAPDGLFDGSPGAWPQVLWRLTPQLRDIEPVEAFFGDFFHPGLLAEISSGQRPKALSDISKKDRRQPQLKIVMDNFQPDAKLAARHVTVKIDIAQAPAGAQDVRLFRNGSLVKVWHDDVLKGKSSISLEATVPMVAGENRLTAYAFNHDNIKSSDATLIINGAESLKQRGIAYILAIGVNEYANPEFRLTYAVADAEDFGAELKRRQEQLQSYEKVQVTSLIDKEATKDRILQTLTALRGQAQPEDLVVIYFAGHGTAQDKQFYLIPHDLGYMGSRENLDTAAMKTILEHSISDRKLEEMFEGIDAGQLVLVIDACRSGQVLESEETRRGPMNSKGLAQLAYEKGMYILTASQSYEDAKEEKALGHGYLTYALVESGLKRGAADREPKNGTINLREWLDFATEEVPEMQRLSVKLRPGEGTQQPRVFYRRELEINQLVIAVVGATSP